MWLRDDCVAVGLAQVDPDRLRTEDLSSIGEAIGCRSLLVLDPLDHSHRAGTGLEGAMVLASGDGLASDTDKLMAALSDLPGLQVDRARQRTFTSLAYFDASTEVGSSVVAVCVDFTATSATPAAQEREFDAWYSYEHMSDVSRAAGIHRAFRMAARDDHPRHYWCLYECDDPQIFMDSRRGTKPWGGLWLDNIDQTSFRRSYFTIACRWTADSSTRVRSAS